MFLRADDGHRWVGTFVADGTCDDTVRELWEWDRLERDLTNPRRLDRDPFPTMHDALANDAEPAAPGAELISTGYWLRDNEPLRQRVCEWLAANGIDCEAVPMDADIWVLDGQIHHEVFRLHGPGPLRESVVAPLVEPWPEQPAPAPAEPPSPRVHIRDRMAMVHDRVIWVPNPPADPDAPTPAELAGGIELGTAPAPATAGQRIRQIGEQLAGVMGRTVAAYQALPAALRGAVEAERDRQALRAACVDEAMFDRALAAASGGGWSVRTMADVVATGWYTESGWTEVDGRGSAA